MKYYKESAHPGKGGVAGMAVPCRGKKKSPGGHVSTSNELKTLSCAGNTKLKSRPCLQRVLFLWNQSLPKIISEEPCMSLSLCKFNAPC